MMTFAANLYVRLKPLSPRSKAVQYNVPGGKKNRGMSVLVSYRLLAPAEEQSEESLTEARIMGWCVEFVSLAEGDDRMCSG